jgi:PilZ domain
MPMRIQMETAAEKHVLISHAGPEAYAPMTRVILAKLGYLILLPDEVASISDLSETRPLVRLLDERQFGDIPDDGDGIPIILLTGRHGATGADARIAGAVKRPVGMHELYRLIQQLSEDTPRSTPRVPTHLTARCRSEGREWTSTVISLSENGCLMRSPEPLPLGRLIELGFDLPRSGRIELEAETAYQLLPDMGMIFHVKRKSDREAIASFVTNALLS